MIYRSLGNREIQRRYWTLIESLNSLEYSVTKESFMVEELSFDEELGNLRVARGHYDAKSVVNIIGFKRFKDLIDRFISSVNRYEGNFIVLPHELVEVLPTDSYLVKAQWRATKALLNL